MIKKEVAEIKKLFAKDTECITRICGCYVDAEKETVSTFQEAFPSLPEDDAFKYEDLFRKTLSGSIQKHLVNLSFDMEQEADGTPWSLLMQLLNSRLTDEDLLNTFYDTVKESYEIEGNYLILLTHNVYDIPGKSSDGSMMEDASDDVYSFLLCSICPVNLAKPGLSYHAEDQMFSDRSRDWVVDAPQSGFLFPAFTDRSMDIHNALFYQKNPDRLQDAFTNAVFGTVLSYPASAQRELFQELVSGVLEEGVSYDVVTGIRETLEEQLLEEETHVMDKQGLRSLFMEHGVETDIFDAVYEDVIPEDASLASANVMDVKKIEVKSPGITVQVKPEVEHLLSTQKVDGRVCLVIALEGDVTVNGISVNKANIS